MSEYTVTYLDGRDGTPSQITVEANDEGEAIEMAQEEYYCGRILLVEEEAIEELKK